MNTTLDIHELCVGDWVQHDMEDPRHPGEKVSRPVKISGVFQEADGKSFIIYTHPWVPEKGVYAPLETFYPLPISAELLQLNGAACVEVGDNGTATPAQYRNRYEKWGIKTTWKDAKLWYDRRLDRWSLSGCDGCNLAYIHELQHAAQLVGLTWEIDALKMY